MSPSDEAQPQGEQRQPTDPDSPRDARVTPVGARRGYVRTITIAMGVLIALVVVWAIVWALLW